MKNSLNWRERRDLQSRLKLQRALAERAARKNPAAFRGGLKIPGGEEHCLGELLEDWQRRDFEALDESWRALAGVTSGKPFWRAYLERPRGHSKTSDLAIQLLWILLHAEQRVEGLAAAADQEQGDLIHTAVKRLADLNPEQCRTLSFHNHLVVNKNTGSRLSVISSDVQSSFGVTPDFVICDELCHWGKQELWHSLLSSAAKKPRCLCVVLTNAGVGRGWQWEIREHARQSGEWYFSSLAGSRASWIRPEQLEEQRRMLPPSVYARLWENRWQEGGGEFVTREEAAACCDENLSYQVFGQQGTRYLAAIDYAEKHDNTVGVVVHQEGKEIIVDRMDVAKPRVGEGIKIAWVDEWIEEVAAGFPGVEFVIDEYQLVGTIQRYEQRHAIQRFAFQGGRGNHALATNLRRLIVNREIRWYPGCGQCAGEDGRDDLETELASVIVRQRGGGQFRVDHVNDGVHHDDRVFALGAACLQLVTTGGEGEWMQWEGSGEFF